MNPVAAMVRWDVRLQRRYGFYTVYAVLTAFYVVAFVGLELPASVAERGLVFIVLSDPAVLGFYFIAALVLIEKREGVLDALVVSPLGVRGYLVSKVASLTLLAVVVATVLALVVHPSGVNVPLLVLGVALTSIPFVLVGFVSVARFDSINDYFLSALLYGAVLYAPLLSFFGLFDTPVFYLLPVRPALILIDGAFHGIRSVEFVYAVGYLSLGSLLAFAVAEREFHRHIVQHRPSRSETNGWNEAKSSRLGAVRDLGPVGGMALADGKKWFRDPLLLVAGTGPLLLALLAHVALPFLNQHYLPTISLVPYYPLVLGFVVTFPPYIYGFVVGFFVLEDREQGVLAALRTTPLTGRGYLRYRGATAYLVGAAVTIPTVMLFGLVRVPPLVLVAVTVVVALAGPTITFLFAGLARDSIEGVVINKLLGLLLIVPVAGIALLPEPWQYVVGVVPLYWPVKALVAGVTDGIGLRFVAFLFLGVLSFGVSIRYLVRRFERMARDKR
ncbi:ABC transporter [Haladaptatus sp.]|uniref:fluoroquinolone export ABC transporter permease subunit n=1 Tax=Haladaptatus sp. TaxID=1973141 RepID=UPI003C5D5D91